jgi:hypothetical protein
VGMLVRLLPAIRPTFMAYALADLTVLATSLYVFGLRPLVWLAQFSWHTYDPTPLPPDGRASVAVLGVHHFGDWQQFMAWADMENPYLMNGGLTALPPILPILRLLSNLSLLQSWLIIAFLSCALTAVATWLMASLRPRRERALIWLLLFGLSAGLWCSVDRGALTTIAGALSLLWWWARMNHRPELAVMFLALAICVKPYLLLLLISPLLERDFRHFVRVIGTVASASLVGFLVLQGAWNTSIGMYLQTTSQYTTQWADFIYYWTHGMLGVVTHPVLLGTGDPLLTLTWIKAFPTWALLAPGAAWLALVTWVLHRRSLSPPLRFALLMSFGMLVVPSSQAYTAIFASCAAVVLLSSPIGPRSEGFARACIQAAVFVSVVPVPLQFGAPEINMGVTFSAVVAPVAWLVAGIACAMSRGERTDQGKGGSPPNKTAVTENRRRNEPVQSAAVFS